ncbi:MAG TPA: hypothetical protein VGQ37_28035 [Vicinamibacterales bacterium]|jgi:hypothetical protein|nr:hypothetical protein [Vicinamibacterales bacterium]
MPATILPFVRRHAADPGPDHRPAAEREPARLPVVGPHAPPTSRPTSRQIAHRWAMLSHLTRHYPPPLR